MGSDRWPFTGSQKFWVAMSRVTQKPVEPDVANGVADLAPLLRTVDSFKPFSEGRFRVDLAQPVTSPNAVSANDIEFGYG